MLIIRDIVQKIKISRVCDVRERSKCQKIDFDKSMFSKHFYWNIIIFIMYQNKYTCTLWYTILEISTIVLDM